MYRVPAFAIGGTQKGSFSWIRVSQEICEKPFHGNPSQSLRKSVNQAPWCHATSWGQGARPCPASPQPRPRLAETQYPRAAAWIHSSAQEAQTRPTPFVLTATAEMMSDGKKSERLQAQERRAPGGAGGSPAQSWAWSRRGWTGILSATTGQSARSAINNCRESFGSHRAIYFTALFQLLEQVELLLKGTSVPLPGPSSPAPRAGLAGAFLQGRRRLCSLPWLGREPCGAAFWG